MPGATPWRLPLPQQPRPGHEGIREDPSDRLSKPRAIRLGGNEPRNTPVLRLASLRPPLMAKLDFAKGQTRGWLCLACDNHPPHRMSSNGGGEKSGLIARPSSSQHDSHINSDTRIAGRVAAVP
jgi:hypothetical protein